ncbi:MAG: winged helix-turn-helix transcriptional regulator [Candidatus Bipolaricaulota bacterium]|nr:MAG: winged helix-turn-helix transcriptional regulator [Candidatus Bipolaricaulota bacterium]
MTLAIHDMIHDAACSAIAETLAVLANPHRVRVLCVLREGEHTVGAIAEAVGLTPAHTSSHLRVLYDRGLVERRREWRRVFYRLRDERVARLLDAALAAAGTELLERT